MLLCSFILVNLLIAIIVDNFDYLLTDISMVMPHHLQKFRDQWAVFDPAATGEIEYTKLEELFRSLPVPCGLGKNCTASMMNLSLMKMNVPITRRGTVDFNAALLSLVRFRLDVKRDTTRGWDTENRELYVVIRDQWPGVSASTLARCLPPPSEHGLTSGVVYAAKFLQKWWRTVGEKRFHRGRLRESSV